MRALALMSDTHGPHVTSICCVVGGRGRTLASFLTSPSLSFICEMGINGSQRIQWGKTHTGPTQSGSGSFYLKGKVLLAGSDLGLGSLVRLAASEGKWIDSGGFFIVSFLVKFPWLLRNDER